MSNVQGTCDPRFEAVRQALAANLASGADLGASVAVVGVPAHVGQLLVYQEGDVLVVNGRGDAKGGAHLVHLLEELFTGPV